MGIWTHLQNKSALETSQARYTSNASQLRVIRWSRHPPKLAKTLKVQRSFMVKITFLDWAGLRYNIHVNKVLSNTIKTNFQILSTKYAKFQPNIQIFEYSISCLVSYINHYFDTNKSKKDVFWAYECCSNVDDTEKIGWKRWKLCFSKNLFWSNAFSYPKSGKRA